MEFTIPFSCRSTLVMVSSTIAALRASALSPILFRYVKLAWVDASDEAQRLGGEC
jgi:hypothetical protein